VEHNADRLHSQIDLVASREAGFFTETLFVEVKHTDGEVGIGDVRQLHSTVVAASTHATPVRGVLVTNGQFTKNARAFATDCGIAAETLHGLVSKTFDVVPLIHKNIERFVVEGVGNSYIDLSCKARDVGTSTIYKPVEPFLDTFLSTTKKPGVVLFGNFGTGKTTLCQHYAHLLSTRWLDGHRDVPIPIYLRLRDVQSFSDIDEVLLSTISHDYEVDVTRSGLQLALSNSNLLLLFDGFDEMASRMDRVTINSNIDFLKKYLSKNRVKVILTCRTHFFRNSVEESQIDPFLALHLCDWGQSELVDYLNRNRHASSADDLARIDSTYNLRELAKTPIFLSMISKTLDDIGRSADQGKLYEIYTDMWIENEEYRSRLLPSEKRQFMEFLADQMFQTGSLEIRFDQLPDAVRQGFSLGAREDVLAFDTEVRTCTFLIRNEAGAYSFVHKSYMEYFVGRRLAQLIKTNDVGAFAAREISVEIASFVGSYFQTEWQTLIRLLAGGATETLRVNSARCLRSLIGLGDVRRWLAVALSAESSEAVQVEIVRALALQLDGDGKRALLTLAEGGSVSSLCAIEALFYHRTDEEVWSVLLGLLEGGSVSQVRVLLEAMQECERLDSKLTTGLRSLVERVNELRDPEVERRLLNVLGSISTAEEQAVFNGYMNTPAMFSTNQPVRQRALDRIWHNIRPVVDQRVRDQRKRGLSRRDCEGVIYGEFGSYVNGDGLSSILDQHFPSARLLKRRRGR
jgi:hypothetical protein